MEWRGSEGIVRKRDAWKVEGGWKPSWGFGDLPSPTPLGIYLAFSVKEALADTIYPHDSTISRLPCSCKYAWKRRQPDNIFREEALLEMGQWQRSVGSVAGY